MSIPASGFSENFSSNASKSCRSKRGSQNTGNICMILCEERFLWSVLFAKPLLPPLPGPSHHLMSGLQESDSSRTPCRNLFAWSTSASSDSARPKPCCKALGCNQSETDLEKIPFSWKQITSPHLTHLECWACCKRRSSFPGWRGCPRGCGSPRSWTSR